MMRGERCYRLYFTTQAASSFKDRGISARMRSVLHCCISEGGNRKEVLGSVSRGCSKWSQGQK